MARFIKRPSRKKRTRYFQNFSYLSCPYRGFSFECDQDGNVPHEKQKDFKQALEDKELLYKGIEEDSWYVYSLGAIECHCGASLALYSYWANSCTECEREYDDSGGLLAPREFWGEETGEVF